MDHVKKILLLLLLASSASAQALYEKTSIPPDAVRVFAGQGVDKTGATDVTAKLITFLQQGGYLLIPDGDYLIAGAGPSAGGAYTVITKNIHVECGPNAVLHGTNLDHSIVRIQVPPNGAGLQAGGISVIWHGCTFDQTHQKTSTSFPFSSTYTSTNQGTSAVTDGLDIIGNYTPVATEIAGIYYAEVSGATFNGGPHWQNAGSGAGGDSGLLCGGVTLCEIHDNNFLGNRDASIYMSNGGTGSQLDVRMDVYANHFLNSFQCVAVKRATLGFSIHDNTCVNAVIGYATQSGGSVVTTGSGEGSIYNNRCSGCQVNDRVDSGTNISIHDEKCDNFGAFLADGVTVPATYTPTGMQLQGMTYSTVHDNVCTSISAAYATLNPLFISLDDLASPLTVSTYNRFSNNRSVGFHSIGGEITASGGDYNEFVEDYEFTGSVHNISLVGTHSSTVRYDPTTGQRAFMNQQLFGDGSAAAPSIARYGDTTTGAYFGSGFMGFSAGGTARTRLSSSGWNTTALVVGAIPTTAISVNSTSPTDQVLGAGAGVSSRLNGRFTADALGAQQYFFKSRNTTVGSNTTIITGDCIGKTLYYADDGTTYNTEVGETSICASGTLGTAQIPGTYFLKIADSAGALKTVLTTTATGSVLGVAGTNTGTLGFAGLTSGVVTVQPQSAAGTYNFNLPITAGSSGQPLLSAAGGSAPMIFGTLGVAAGGTGAVTAQAASQALSVPYVICASGATVSAGADTSEDTLYTCTIPANSLGANGAIRYQALFTHTSSSNNKIIRVRYSTAAGTAYFALTDTTTTSNAVLPSLIQNKNATGSQEGWINTSSGGGASSGTVNTSSADTTGSTTLVFTCAKASSGETCSLNHVTVEILYAP